MTRVQRVEQAQQHVGLEAQPAFHADRIADAAQIFDVRRAFEAGAVADPQHMARGVVPASGQAVLPGQRLLIGKQQRLVAGVRSEEHTSELQSLMRTSYAVFLLKKNIIYSS